MMCLVKSQYKVKQIHGFWAMMELMLESKSTRILE